MWFKRLTLSPGWEGEWGHRESAELEGTSHGPAADTSVWGGPYITSAQGPHCSDFK